MKIHLEIEATPAALTHAADTLRRMAGGLAACVAVTGEPTHPVVMEAGAIHPDAFDALAGRASGPTLVPDAAPGAPSDTDLGLVGDGDDTAGDPPFPPLDTDGIEGAAGDPPPPPAKPITPISPFRPAPADVELDSDGLPWDERIHSRGKTLLAKTRQWKRARNLDEETIVAVEAELRVKYPAPVKLDPNAPNVKALRAVVQKDIDASIAAAGESRKVLVGLRPDVDAPPPPPSDDAPGDPTVRDFPTLMRLVTAAKITQPQLMEACKGVGVVPALLPRRPDLIPAVAEALGLKL